MAKSVTSSSSTLQVIGHSVTRIDARAKVTGEAQFSGDRMPTDGLLHGKTLRSPHPHAEIVGIDTAKADGLPGVRAVVTFRDAPESPFEEGDDSEEPLAPVYVLNRIVRHVGDEVAAVAADSEQIAEEALRLIEVEYRTLPFVLDAEPALARGAPSIRGGSNLAGREPILLSAATSIAAWRKQRSNLEETYRTQSTSPLPLEPRYSLARWEGDQLTVWKASRNVYGDRDKLAKVFGLLSRPEYGSSALTWAAALAAKTKHGWRRSRRCLRAKQVSPCAWDIRRRKNWVAENGVTRRQRVSAWDSSATATITAIDATSALNTGPYAPGFGVASRLGHGLTYLYSCPNARFVGKVAFTNSPVAGSYRGLGAPRRISLWSPWQMRPQKSFTWTRWSFDSAITWGRKGSRASAPPRWRVSCLRSPSKAEFRSPVISWRNASTKGRSESVGNRVPEDPGASRSPANFAAWESPAASIRPASPNRLRL